MEGRFRAACPRTGRRSRQARGPFHASARSHRGHRPRARRQDRTERAAKRRKEERVTAIGDYLWQETRARTRPQLDELVERVEPRAGWDDIVLPPRQRDILRTIAAQVSRRSFVHEQWGFGREGARGLGISALFAGPSGTGKSLAAEVIGAAVGLEVYRSISPASSANGWARPSGT